mmetsp:Transcript_21705/g.31494  ORF Transcript_21705/g.31494 Transcript_21705/m.31494 type:complete len:269 (-) Transcript_21705:163-969(-)|eukprot:CAMPEP_0113937488 /NCGR_PEP_ID=MMETSP1339-20121228/4105_1 /TAXON_ID=94617 /ORGANISM="Fibrocapsa japonica" /LENGTH=268 /DNA_ID=CAMNT_0000940281 /DNA_START=74 /DNA_END=880 /DNA_ORIENTATION=+ /assembly_acc=CAM_ASM_000762
MEVIKCIRENINDFIYHTDYETLKTHAVYGAYLSLLAGVIEFFLSLLAGKQENDSSIIGISAMALNEVASSCLVLWRWQCSMVKARSEKNMRLREAAASMAVGAAMMMPVAGILAVSLRNLAERREVEGNGQATFNVSCFSALWSFLLYAYKFRVGSMLNSMLVKADARSSLCAGLVSFAVIAAEFLIFDEHMWYADDLMGLALVCYISYVAYHIMLAGFKEIRYIRNDEADADGYLDLDLMSSNTFSNGPTSAKQNLDDDHGMILSL